ncbi:MAG TPA: TadE/TadG family type IV pilus assembly protein [Marmoricola sp.]|nr:TadE/TadG family type IV pilus assembly protein [Marmoricola sp.]
MRRPRGRGDSGATAVEFALVMVPLVALLFGIIQYGLYFWAFQGGNDIARSAARLAAVGDPADCAQFKSDVKSQISGLIGDPSTASITRTLEDSDGVAGRTTGDNWKVTVEFHSIDLHFPFVPFINGGVVSATGYARADYFVDPSNPPPDCS